MTEEQRQNAINSIEWLQKHYEQCSERYRDNEKFLMQLSNMSRWQLLWKGHALISDHFIRMLNKYKFDL